MDREYEAKEEARMHMREALQSYINAAKSYGSDTADVASEINDVFTDIGEPDYKVIVAE
jgi:uncharacterized protein YfcZ (UPF0381/DUF406 family)